MNNAIKLTTVRRYAEHTSSAMSVLKKIGKAAIGFYTLFCLAVYACGYAMYELNKFLNSDTAKGMLVFYRLYVRMWIYAVAGYAVTVGLFGIEAGIILLSLAIPVVLIKLIILSKSEIKKK